ncbi:MAG: DUF6684 family protein [Haloarculaceae archaeon]
MSEKVFDRETLLDLTVNVIPFGILVIFFGGYLLFNPWGFDSVISGVQLAIIGVSAAGLMILTYFSGAAVSKAEKRSEAALEAEETAELESGDAADEEAPAE